MLVNKAMIGKLIILASWHSLYLLDRVSIFRTSEQGFVADILSVMAPLFAVQEEVIDACAIFRRAYVTLLKAIINADEVGKEFYILHSGRLYVTDKTRTEIFARLKDGSIFGEIALLFDTPRTASCISSTFCDLFQVWDSILTVAVLSEVIFPILVG